MPYAQAPIGDHAAIGDGRSIALITTSGAIDWLCWPRFDSPAIFAGLLDAERGGSWRIAPTGPARASRRYLPDRLRAGPGLFWRNERARAVAEGAFGICSAWAVDYLTRAGRLDDARRELDAFLAYGNDVGLFAEEIDPRDGAALGNFPQAYTHVGLINAALGLAAAAPGVRARAGGTR